PSSSNCTPATPTLSVAVAVTSTESKMTEPAAGAVTATAGGVVSAGGGSAWIAVHAGSCALVPLEVPTGTVPPTLRAPAAALTPYVAAGLPSGAQTTSAARRPPPQDGSQEPPFIESVEPTEVSPVIDGLCVSVITHAGGGGD